MDYQWRERSSGPREQSLHVQDTISRSKMWFWLFCWNHLHLVYFSSKAGYGKRPGALGPNVPDVPTHTFPVAVNLLATALSPFSVPWPQFINLSKALFFKFTFFFLPVLTLIPLLAKTNLSVILLSSEALLLAFATFINSLVLQVYFAFQQNVPLTKVRD